MEDQNRMKRAGSRKIRGEREEERRSWNKRKYLATSDVFSKSRVMLKRDRA